MITKKKLKTKFDYEIRTFGLCALLLFVFTVFFVNPQTNDINNDNEVIEEEIKIEEDLNNNGIKLLRTDIGDKYVLSKILEKNLSLGGEQSGHIIIKDLATTGDGLLTAIVVMEMIIKSRKKASENFKVNLYPQTNINVEVKNKMRIICI